MSRFLKNLGYKISTEIVSGKSAETFFERGGNIKAFLNDEANGKPSAVSLRDSKAGLERFKDGVEGFYATNGFELLDVTPNLPLSQFWYQSLIPIRFGGGFVEQVSAFRLQYQTALARLAGGNTNVTPLADATSSKISVPAYVFQMGILVGEIDELKASHINYDILGAKLEALRLSYQREIEWFAFMGNDGVGDITSSSTNFRGGLLNATEGVDDTTTFANKDWLEEKDLNKWVSIIVGKYAEILRSLQYNYELAPNRIAVPTELYTLLQNAAVVGTINQSNGTGIATSMLDYLETELYRRARKAVLVVELPYLNKDATTTSTTAGIVANGVNGTGMIVIYTNSDRSFRLNIPMPLISGIIAWSPTETAFRQTHTAVVTTPLFVYPVVYRIHNGVKEPDGEGGTEPEES